MRQWIRILALAGLVIPGTAAAARFAVTPGHDNKVVFTSKAQLESFQGKTDRIEGTIEADPAGLGDSATVSLEVDLASLDTGIDVRNRHMREKHLETAKYPKAVFKGAAVMGPAGARLEVGKPVPVEVEGTFALHGIERRLRTVVEVTLLDAGAAPRLKLHAHFQVSLTDYAISRPAFLFLKLSDVQEVDVTAIAVGEAAASR